MVSIDNSNYAQALLELVTKIQEDMAKLAPLVQAVVDQTKSNAITFPVSIKERSVSDEALSAPFVDIPLETSGCDDSVAPREESAEEPASSKAESLVENVPQMTASGPPSMGSVANMQQEVSQFIHPQEPPQMLAQTGYAPSGFAPSSQQYPLQGQNSFAYTQPFNAPSEPVPPQTGTSAENVPPMTMNGPTLMGPGTNMQQGALQFTVPKGPTQTFAQSQGFAPPHTPQHYTGHSVQSNFTPQWFNTPSEPVPPQTGTPSAVPPLCGPPPMGPGTNMQQGALQFTVPKGPTQTFAQSQGFAPPHTPQHYTGHSVQSNFASQMFNTPSEPVPPQTGTPSAVPPLCGPPPMGPLPTAHNPFSRAPGCYRQYPHRQL